MWLSRKQGWRFTKQVLHADYLYTCHQFQKSVGSQHRCELNVDCQIVIKLKTLKYTHTHKQQKLPPEESIAVDALGLAYTRNAMLQMTNIVRLLAVTNHCKYLTTEGTPTL